MTSGVPGLSSMVWSHGHFGGNHWATSSLNTLACCWYFSGTLILVVYCSACHARSVEMELIMTSSVKMSTIRCFASSDTVLPIRVLAIVGFCSTFTRRIDGRRTSVYQLGDQMTIGSMLVSTVASFHENCGSNVASQGYPKIMSSTPRSVTKNRIFFSCPLVFTSRSMKCVSHLARLVVPSMFHIFISCSNSCIPTRRHLTNFGWIKLSVA